MAKRELTAAVSPWVLAAAVALLFFLWSDQFLAPPDCAFYWAWADALISTNSLSFLPAFDKFEIPTWYGYVTQTGRMANDWPMGTGLMILPAAWAGPVWAHAWLLLLCAVVLTFWWRTVSTSVSARIASITAIIVGTPLLFYALFGPFFSHIASFIAVTAFLVMWSQDNEDKPSRRWLTLGLLLGLSTLVRPQNVLLAVVFLADLPYLISQARKAPARFLKHMLLPALIGFFLGIAPRFPAYNVLYGNPLALPKLEEMRWMSPHVLQTLFSDYHGILPWTPVYALAMVGLILGLRTQARLFAGLLLVFCTQFYINAANEVWWSGGSFGNRRLTDYSIIVAWGILALVSLPNHISRLIALGGITVSCFWTLTLLFAERRLLVPLDRYVSFSSEGFMRALADVYLQPDLTWHSLTRAVNTDTLQRALAAFLLFAMTGVLFRVSGSVTATNRIAGFARTTGMILVLIVIIWLSVASTRTPPLDASARAQFGTKSLILWDNYAELAGYHLSREEYRQADYAARKAIAIREDGPAAYWYSGIALLNQGNDDQAAQRFRQLLQYNPSHQGALELLKNLEEKPVPVSGETEKPATDQKSDWRVQ